VANRTGYSLGSAKFSPDGSRVVYYEITTENTFGARLPYHVDDVASQIVSVDFATGSNRIEHTSGAGVKVFPQYVTTDTIGFLRKASGNPGTIQGLNFTSTTPGGATNYSFIPGTARAPAWSPDGTLVVYQKISNTPVRPLEKEIYSWQDDWEYRFLDVFPKLSLQGVVTLTSQQTGNSSAVTLNPDGTNEQLVFSDVTNSTIVPQVSAIDGGFEAFQPSWSADGEWITVGWGNWFQARDVGGGVVVRATSNGSYWEILTNSSVLNSGFPSFSPDGESIVYRTWGTEGPLGLRLLNLTDRSVTVLTTEWDNLPGWSPDGSTIVFTRRTSVPIDGPYQDDYNICTIKPDGSDFTVLTTSGANDAHAVWTNDGRITYSTGEFGFQDEASLYDDQFQPYAQIMVMEADGSNKTALTNGIWEDAMPLFVPNENWS
jgi:Tol biopolymer transport system component